jgi:deazaflavin-dependent oxidoreductase (nitroreductase family)
VPGDLVFKVLNTAHRGALKLSGGRVGWKAAKMPVIELTTTGRRTGRPHTVMLTTPWQDGSALVVVASRGGDDRPPAWLLNVIDRPEVLVATGGGGAAKPMWARVASADDRARLWPLVTAKFPHYANYQTRTTREIALVLLEPAA